jgi:ubiquinone/menaquinone biosynthesis C-methylase UbiE
MILSIEQWHQRYSQQAYWTRSIRNYLFQKCELQSASKVLDIGCGTGVLENDFPNHTHAHIFALDIDYQTLQFARSNPPIAFYTAGDCLSLPFSAAVFDVTLCHFLLLWIARTGEALAEMRRVTRPGGYVLALAEPDYGGRIDYPYECSKLGEWQTQALKEQGANPYMGRQLRALFSNVGFIDIEVGVLGGQWGKNQFDRDFELEWQVLSSDLQDKRDFTEQAGKYKSIELTARAAQQRVLFVPVFYACGVVPA